MADKRELLAFELRQIIQADRDASDIISEAEETKRSIEKDTEKKKAEIFADADKALADMEARVKAEHEAAITARKQELAQSIAAQEDTLRGKMDENREKWADEIVARVTTV